MRHEAHSQEKGYSQHGEDILAWEYLESCPNGFIVEVGANDPINLSQSYFFELKGWQCLLVEPLPDKAALLRSKRKGIVCEAGAGSPQMAGKATIKEAKSHEWSYIKGDREGIEIAREIEITIKTLETILDENEAPQIDILSIDTEGMEIDVLEGIDLDKRKPKLLMLEDHMDDLELYFYMRKRGYRLVKRTGVNNWWIPKAAPRPKTTLREDLSRWNALIFKQPKKRARWIMRKFKKQPN